MYLNRPANYDKHPFVPVPGHTCAVGWEAIIAVLAQEISAKRTLLAVECYSGVDDQDILAALGRLHPALVVRSADALLPYGAVDRLVEPFLGGDDPVFGYLTNLRLEQFFDAAALEEMRRAVAEADDGLILVVGCGATLIAPRPDVLIYADLARWEAQLRFRRNEADNLGAANRTASAASQYKRAFFVDWRVADRFKKPLLRDCDYVLDTNTPTAPKLATGAAVREGLARAARQPFRVVPLFDPAPWGGQWMKEVCDLDRGPANYGWCFDCVPEENSLCLGFGDVHNFEIPSLDLVFLHPRELFGEAVHGRFGDEFPIRFDFLDTMDGGNLSLQVHPLTEYIQQAFGMHYTQDESYYMLDAAADACVYLGVKTGVDPNALVAELEAAQAGGSPFDAGRFTNCWPAKKHDHFLIPAGTIHCSGRNAMVLEISATPYIFTFKLWDWSRLGLDGRPRPIHIGHGKQVLQYDRDTAWTRRELINRVEPLATGDGWTEERTGLHEREFIETRRHWFTKRVPHDTHGGLNVLNLVEGQEAVVESPDNAFRPMVVHYAETFIVPAAVGPYTIRPHGPLENAKCGTMKAFVR